MPGPKNKSEQNKKKMLNFCMVSKHLTSTTQPRQQLRVCPDWLLRAEPGPGLLPPWGCCTMRLLCPCGWNTSSTGAQAVQCSGEASDQLRQLGKKHSGQPWRRFQVHKCFCRSRATSLPQHMFCNRERCWASPRSGQRFLLLGWELPSPCAAGSACPRDACSVTYSELPSCVAGPASSS